MLKFLLKRILLFIPTLIIISFIAFGLSKVPSADPVESCYGVSDEVNSLSDEVYAAKIYRQNAQTLGVDKPPFYFSIHAKAYPDTLYRILRKDHRENVKKLIAQYGNDTAVLAYFQQIKETERQLLNTPVVINEDNKSNTLRALRQLPIAYKDGEIQARLENINTAISADSIFHLKMKDSYKALKNYYQKVKENTSRTDLYVPTFSWFGTDNQYHNWITKFLKGDFGISCEDKRPVSQKINEALFWTLIMNVGAILLSYLIAIPLGITMAARRGSRYDRWIGFLLFVLYSLPVFWIGTLLLMFFATPIYGLQIFPGVGLGDTSAGAPFWTLFWDRVTHLTLPVFCIAYPSFAYLARQMRGAMNETLQQDYIRTARAKGLPGQKVLRYHAFRNALFPLITLLASVFPRVLAGSVIIEVIFNIPGMGKLAFDALLSHDWNIVFTILMLSAVLTMIGILVADILYAWADPRLRR